MIKEHYTTPAAVIECDLRKEIMMLKMQLADAQRQLRQAHEVLNASEFSTPPAPLPDRLNRWMLTWKSVLDDFRAEQKAVIEEWKAKR